MKPYSAWKVFVNGLTGQKGWDRAWRDPEPKAEYDVVIVGAGLHGLATAYYLAKNHDIKNIAVVEKGWLGGGNGGRNTTIVRSNYMLPGNREFYEHSLKLWENLSHDLNYNVMFSQRAHVTLLHSPAARDGAARRYNTMRLTGSDGDTDPLSFGITVSPAHGTLSNFDAVAGTVTYTPAPDYNGPDGFEFQVDDGKLGTATAVVSITVDPVNDPPSASGQAGTAPGK